MRFIDLSLSRLPSYATVLNRLKDGGSFLDIGCCFAQDIRKLVHDGAPSGNLWGAELQAEFIELGFDLFNDRDSLVAHFLTADIFDSESPLKQLTNSIDVIHVGLFLHLFDWDGQKKACETIVGLLKAEKGVLVLGQQVGSLVPGQVPRSSGSQMYKHDATTFAKLWKEVGEATGTEWEVRAALDAGLGIGQQKRRWDDPDTRRLTFEVERLK
jgi:SAM-dependent methyltransferase